MNLVLLALVVFVMATASDYLETRYVLAVNAGDAPRAALSSVAMQLVGVAGLVAVVEVGWWLLAPETIGLYFGTMLAMRR